jgi:hypothetical protein
MERRPAPVDNGVERGVPHGAPVLWGGELAALTRDASFLRSPNTRGVKALHAAVFSTGLTNSHGLRLGSFGAACNPNRIMLYDELFYEAREVKEGARCQTAACQALFAAADRQHRDLARIRAYYQLEERHGIRVGLGLRVRHVGRPGVIIDTAEQLLIVRLDDEPRLVKGHPTANMEYEGPDGWVRPTPVTHPASPAEV